MSQKPGHVNTRQACIAMTGNATRAVLLSIVSAMIRNDDTSRRQNQGIDEQRSYKRRDRNDTPVAVFGVDMESARNRLVARIKIRKTVPVNQPASRAYGAGF